MNFGDVMAEFRKKLDALNFKEWSDPIRVDNIPSTIIDRAYNMQIGQITGAPANSRVHDFKMPLTIRFFLKGYRNPQEALNAGLNEVNAIYAAILAPSFRLGFNGLKDVRPVTVQPFPLSETNDRSIVFELGFECFLIYNFQ